MVDKNKAVVCCLLATSAIMLSEKKKRKSVKCAVRSDIWKGIYHAILLCWMNCWKRMCLEMVPSWYRQVNWGNCGILWVNCGVPCVWRTTGKYSSEACVIAYQNCAVYSVFPSGMTLPSKIAQFKSECVGRFTLGTVVIPYRRFGANYPSNLQG